MTLRLTVPFSLFLFPRYTLSLRYPPISLLDIYLGVQIPILSLSLSLSLSETHPDKVTVAHCFSNLTQTSFSLFFFLLRYHHTPSSLSLSYILYQSTSLSLSFFPRIPFSLKKLQKFVSIRNISEEFTYLAIYRSCSSLSLSLSLPLPILSNTNGFWVMLSRLVSESIKSILYVQSLLTEKQFNEIKCSIDKTFFAYFPIYR